MSEEPTSDKEAVWKWYKATVKAWAERNALRAAAGRLADAAIDVLNAADGAWLVSPAGMNLTAALVGYLKTKGDEASE